MAAESEQRRPPAAAIILLVTGLIAGVAGGLVTAPLLTVFQDQDLPPEARLTGERTLAPATGGSEERAGSTLTQTGNAPGPASDTAAPPPDPAAENALRALRERRAAEAARLRERAVLASESPLTPPITNVAEPMQRPENPAASGSGDAPEGVVSGGGAPAPAPPAPPQDFVLARGSVIPAVLESALDSDLPGLVRARVSRDVFDTVSAARVLIPRGARLVGTYRQDARSGQRRLFVAWTDLRMPDGTPVDLDTFSTLGADGAAGVKGKRRTGILAALGAAILFDLAGNATQILTGEDSDADENDIGALIAAATGKATSRVSERYLGTLLEGGPRFRVAAGTIMNVLVEEDLTLPEVRTPR